MVKKDPDHIIVAGKKIFFIIKEIEMADLEYYPDNPRINHILTSIPPPVTQEIIEEKLWEQDSVKELYQDIKKNRGLIEEIFVRKDEVIEGNSRLCAYRYLYKKAKTGEEKRHWKTIRAKILPDDISEEEVFVLLGTLHIKLKAQWKPYEKAGYEHRMVEKLNRTVNQLSELLNTSEQDVQTDIDSYNTMKSNEIRDIDKFSYFKEYYKNPELQKKQKTDNTFLNTFVEWVQDDRIPRAEAVRQLPHILNDKKVGPKFRDGFYDFETAYEQVKKRHPEIGGKQGKGNLYKHMKKMENKLKNAPIQKIIKEIEIDHNKKAVVEYFVKEVGRFADNIGCIKKYKGK